MLVALGIAALAICAKIKVPVWPSPVAISLGTFAVLTIGAAYGPRLGLATIARLDAGRRARLRRVPELLGGEAPASPT